MARRLTIWTIVAAAVLRVSSEAVSQLAPASVVPAIGVSKLVATPAPYKLVPAPPPPPPVFPSPPQPAPVVPSKPQFFLGTATSAYQVEGAYDVEGRGFSIWDVYHPIYMNQTGNTSIDFYHRYEDDIRLLQSLGLRRFRLSIAWPRVVPTGNGSVNAAGLAFYSRLINALLAAGITPYVTVFHWDLPQVLQDLYGGWLGPQVADDYAAYAAAVFQALGDRVVHWTTFNEPWTFCFNGYGKGVHAPGLKDLNGTALNVWKCTHNVLRAHAKAVAAFRALVPGGKIGMNLNIDWSEPATGSPADVEAATRHMEFMAAIFADPVYKGDWPSSVKSRVVGLPPITPELAAALHGTFDLFHLNFYTAKFVSYSEGALGEEGQGRTDCTEAFEGPAGRIGPTTDSSWLAIVPWALRKMLVWVNDRYQPSEILITENGVDVPDESNMALSAVVNDTFRIDFYRAYVHAAMEAVALDNVPLKGYFAWSAVDNFEWGDGYGKRFGLIYVDYNNNLTRHVKHSARWLANFFDTV